MAGLYLEVLQQFTVLISTVIFVSARDLGMLHTLYALELFGTPHFGRKLRYLIAIPDQPHWKQCNYSS